MTHNILVCKASGAVIDFSAGQFSGKLEQPRFHSSFKVMVASGAFPTEVLRLEKSPQDQIDVQLQRDVDNIRVHLAALRLPFTNPAEFAALVVKNATQTGWNGICRECFGSSAKLFRCTRCAAVSYCGPICQKLAWRREHKHECVEKEQEK